MYDYSEIKEWLVTNNFDIRVFNILEKYFTKN